MENRSFDHMLGYLSLTGGRADIDGLRPGLANEYQGRSYPVHHLATTKVDVDPDHTASAVDVQVDGGRMGGFVASLAATIADRGVHGGDPSPAVGYYDGADVPVYDHLAEEFLVCDRWFSSVPGATWPNRLYALCGSAAGGRDDLPPHVPPIYHKPSFVRHLDEHGVSWRWYCFDTPTLRLADARYTAGHHHHFGYFSKTGLSWKTKLEIRIDARAASFLEDAASGSLPSVSWIDPAFTSFNPLGFRPNDDHAPADIRDGQDLVLAVYDALATSPAWERSLLVIVYDEHGGFYDHVPPPQAPKVSPELPIETLGIRVPAFVVSPWVKASSVFGNDGLVFDHTSLLKTIARRFLSGAPPFLGARYAAANDLSAVLTNTPRPNRRFRPFLRYEFDYLPTGLRLGVNGDQAWQLTPDGGIAQEFSFEDAG